MNKLSSFLSILVFSSFSLFSHADQVASISTDEGKAFIQKLSDEVIQTIQSKSSASEIESKLDSIFTEAVDTKWMGGYALGRYARTIDEKDRATYNAAYTNYLEKSYVPRFRQYTNQKIKIIGAHFSDPVVIVQTEIVQQDNVAARIDYHVGRSSKGLVIRDISVEGVSLIQTQRSDFSSVLSRGGIQVLTDNLNNHSVQNSQKQK